MSEPTLSADELRRYSTRSQTADRDEDVASRAARAGGHGVQGEPGTATRSAHETPAALVLHDRLRAVVVAHRVSIDVVDPLVRDLVAVIADHNEAVL